MGKLADNRRLYDIAIRLQVFVERVKLWQSLQFAITIYEAASELRKLLSNLKFDSLDLLTKRELNLLVAKLRQAQAKLYSVATVKLIKQLEEFMHAALFVNRVVYASAYLDEDEEIDPVELSERDAFKLIEDNSNFTFLFGLAAVKPERSNNFFSTVKTEPIAANGALVIAFIRSMTASAQLTSESRIRKGYSNATTVRETLVEAAKDSAKIANQSEAVIATTMQHIASMVSMSITSGLFGKYEWVSVIDSGTTDICRSRNHKIYEYGKGPVPPAHIRCRSSIVPFRGKSSPQESLGGWLERQNPQIQDAALGRSVANKFREGKVSKSDVHRLASISPMSIDQFKDSVSLILIGK